MLARVWPLLPFVGLLWLTGCDTPAVGTWESDAKLGNGKHNKLELADDLGGDATIFATSCTTCNDWTTFKFKVEWEEDGEAVDLDLECKSGPCDGNDFKMECEVSEEDDGVEKMDCSKMTGNWKSYPFDWERDE
jgi:hypothetical protein